MAKKIEHLAAIVSVDKDGNEGILYLNLNDRTQPLIAGDAATLEKMKPLGAAKAVGNPRPVKIVYFEKVSEEELGSLETDEPGEEG